MKASIIIPTLNKLPRLKLTLMSLENQDYPIDDFEVIIVDDSSTDGSEEYLMNFDTKLKHTYLRNDKSLGRAGARNKGAEYANNEILIFIDDDVLLPTRFISKHIEHQMQETKIVHGRICEMSNLKFFSDPVKGEIYPQFDNPQKDYSHLRAYCISDEDIINNFSKIEKEYIRINSLENVIELLFTNHNNKYHWLGFTGGNVSLPKEWFFRAGMFDCNFGLKWGSEDLELGYRLDKLGFKFMYSYATVNYHMTHFRLTYQEDYLATSEYFYHKYEDKKLLYLEEFIAGKMNSKQLFKLLTEQA